MPFSDFLYSLPKSNSSCTIKSAQSSSNLNNTNTTTATNISSQSKHQKNKQKLLSNNDLKKSTQSGLFNKSNKEVIESNFNKNSKQPNPKLAPEIIFLIKEHAKTLETINQISKKLQELELKVDNISQRLNNENSLDNNLIATSSSKLPLCKNKNNLNSPTNTNSNFIAHNASNSTNTNLNGNSNALNRLSFSTLKETDVCNSSNNTLANTNNIPNNQILSDDSGGEYGNRTNKTVSEEDELLSILDKITKCSHHILQTQKAQQQQANIIYNSLPKYCVYNAPNNSNNTDENFLQASDQQRHNLAQQSTVQQLANSTPQLNPLVNRRMFEMYSNYTPQHLHQQHNIPTINSYLLNTMPIHFQGQQLTPHPAMIPIAAPTIQPKYPTQQASLNELLFEQNIERFLNNLDQLVTSDDTNFAGILCNQAQPKHIQPILTNTIPMLNAQSYIHQQHHHHLNTSTPISSRSIPNILTTLRSNTTNLPNANPAPILNNTRNIVLPHNFNLNNNLSQTQFLTSKNNGNTNKNNNTNSTNNTIPSNNTNNGNISHNNSELNGSLLNNQQILNWQIGKAKELIEKKERERIDAQLKQADEWLTSCLNRKKYQQHITNTTQCNLPTPNSNVSVNNNISTHSNNNTNNNLIQGAKDKPNNNNNLQTTKKTKSNQLQVY